VNGYKVGSFKNPGAAWNREAVLVNDHDFKLFGEVSKNWAGEPLESYEKILNYMRTVVFQGK